MGRFGGHLNSPRIECSTVVIFQNRKFNIRMQRSVQKKRSVCQKIIDTEDESRMKPVIIGLFRHGSERVIAAHAGQECGQTRTRMDRKLPNRNGIPAQ